MKKSAYIWRKILITKTDIELRTLLTCGQAFSWKETSDNVWSNVLNGVAFSLSQTPTELLWCTPLRDLAKKLPATEDAKGISIQPSLTHLKRKRKADSTNNKESSDGNEEMAKRSTPSSRNETCSPPHSCFSEPLVDVTDEQAEAILRDYFQLSVDLPSLYTQWAAVDKNFEKIADTFLGIRIMRQDPTENLFSFICSSNNHVSRISGMVQKLSEHFGQKIGTIEQTTLYAFPTAADLDKPEVETKLRALSFGYRAKYIAATARMVNRERPEGWLNSLRELPYDQCISELSKLQGVGRKVADCVSLMSLDKTHVVPVDTHVLQIAARDYHIPGIGRDMKSLTPAIHDKIGKYFLDLYGDYAGWAHTVLFAADLKRFSDHISSKSSKPAAKSSKPAAKSSKPAAKSSKPAAKSSKPAAKSSKPAAKSSKPAAKSIKPVAKSSKPVK